MTDFKKSIEKTGFLKIEGLFDRELLDSFYSEVNEMEHWLDAKGKYWRYYEEGDAKKLNRMENFLDYTEFAKQVILHPKLLSILSEIMIDEPVLFKEKINFKTSGGAGFEYHQDQAAGWSKYAPIFWSVAIAIDPCDTANGCLEIANHISKSRKNLGDWEPLGEAILQELNFEPVPLDPGDIVIFDSYVPHGSKRNSSKRPRKIMYLTYNQKKFGDLRSLYYEDKMKTYPQDCERIAGKKYEYKV